MNVSVAVSGPSLSPGPVNIRPKNIEMKEVYSPSIMKTPVYKPLVNNV